MSASRPFGRQAWSQETSSTTVSTLYDYDLKGRLLAEYDGASDTVLREYVWLDDDLIAVVDSASGTANILYVHTGQIGEPQVMTDASQAEVWNGYVDPYGAAQTFATPSATMNLRLPGQWARAATGGLSQNWNRDYDPALGRYAQADPLGIDAGQNVYAYVDGDSLNLSDARGLRPYTGGELAGLLPIFGRTINYNNVDIINGPGSSSLAAIAFAFGTPAITLGNTIFVNRKYYLCDFSNVDLPLLAHETTHMYQYTNTLPGGVLGPLIIAINSLAMGGQNPAYDISKVTANTPFNSLGYEQQAAVVGAYSSGVQGSANTKMYGQVIRSANPPLLTGGH